jgi:serine phosphatase RsbU (regulator of sigma subunit)
VVELEAIDEAYREFSSYLKRNETIEKMFAISAVSREWALVAETQRSFLPKAMPQAKGLELASCFKPLVNVSGDFYDAIPLSEDKTLLILGDVSGKGLAAALIMGVVVNTIRTIERKDDLEALARAVDSAIKGMRLQDKYTVLFIGLVDTKEMKIRYVNASMADTLVISETRAGRQIRRMESNCSILGILDLDSIQVDELRLFPGDVVLIASDGVSEVPGPKGEMLGDTVAWTDYVLDGSTRPMEDFVQGLAELAETYSSGVPLRDDITILAAKLGA